MPELPEVETIRTGLERVLPGRVFAQVDIHYAGSIKKPAAAEFRQNLIGRTVRFIGRRGKYLQISLDDESMIVIHLRMTGKLIFSLFPIQLDKHTHVVFHFTDGAILVFNDIRKFGTIYWLTQDRFYEIHGLYTLGPEPLSNDFHVRYLLEKSQNRKGSIKALLLNQEVIAGLGNIYADEALHRAGIRPDRPAHSLSFEELAALYITICQVLHEAIDHHGTTMSDYRDADGSYGQFQEYLRVYQRGGKPCHACGQIIIRMLVAGRGTHYCPQCQK